MFSFQNPFVQLQQKLVPTKNYKKGEAGWRKIKLTLLSYDCILSEVTIAISKSFAGGPQRQGEGREREMFVILLSRCSLPQREAETFN